MVFEFLGCCIAKLNSKARKLKIKPILTILQTTAWGLLLSPVSTASECINMHVIENAPIGYLDDQGNATGVHWDYLTAIEEESGVCIQKQLFPYARIWKSYERGAHDGGIIFRTPDREALVEGVSLVRVLKVVVVPEKGSQLTSYESLSGLVIGKTRGTRLSRKFDTDTSLNKLDLDNYQQAARMLDAGRINAIAGSGVVLAHQLSLIGSLESVNLTGAFVLGSREQWLLLSKKSKHLDKIPALQKAIATLKENGVLDDIMTKYYGENWRVLNPL
jgi:ABC-type amino acid transport substrate-binding protein